MKGRVRIPMGAYLRIAQRDNWTCHWCGVGYMPNDPWEIDHIKSKYDGGQDLASNLALCHRSCNRGKGRLSA